MTLTLAGAEIHGYYAALGIHIAACATSNASVRCFAAPDSHQRGDRHPSASIDLVSGAFYCHGCGADGGAYDAALTQGHTPRSAIDLMITHGLAERRSRLFPARELTRPSAQRRPPRRRRPAALQATDVDVTRWQRALARRLQDSQRLQQDRGWAADTMRELGLGIDRGRITIPIRDADQVLIGVLRYRPYDTGQPKMLAVPGSRLGLIPHPAQQNTTDVLLVEGPPDMIAARSHDLPAIAVPGDHAWRDEWAPLFAGRHVTVIMDADSPGRHAAQRIHDALSDVTEAEVVDLAADRDDGYDLSDWLLDRPGHVPELLQTLGGLQR